MRAVKDRNGQPAVNEVQAKHLLAGKNLPVNDQAPETVQEPVEGLLSVYRPRLGYRYGFQWWCPNATRSPRPTGIPCMP